MIKAFLEKEHHIMKSIEHQSIIRYLDSFISANNYHLIMELFNGKTLGEFIEIPD